MDQTAIAKLPKWAQQAIQAMNRRIEQLELELAAMANRAPAKGASGKVMVGFYDHRFPVHDLAGVTFCLKDGAQITVRMSESGEFIDVNAAAHQIAILPRAANCAWIAAKR